MTVMKESNKFMKINYRKASKNAYKAYKQWRRDCPHETANVVSFAAGYNAAMAMGVKYTNNMRQPLMLIHLRSK